MIVNKDAFEAKGLEQAGYERDPLDDGSLKAYRVFPVDDDEAHARLAVEELGLSQKEADRCRNFFAMGLVFWLYDRPLEPTLRYIDDKFGKSRILPRPIAGRCMAGYNYGETTEAFTAHYAVAKAKLPPGTYRSITGNQALAWGLMTAAQRSSCDLFFGSYPITPASDILHELTRYKNFGVRTFQAEDEIAAMTSAIGAAFGGAMAVTTSSGPGIALKQEAIGLAVMTELPVLIINVQRGGPSTGLPTKTEQADLLQAICGRNGECPVPVLAARSPADCFDIAQEAWQIAVRYMTPVLVLTDGYMANGSEPWRIPDATKLSPIEVEHPGPSVNGEHIHALCAQRATGAPLGIAWHAGLDAPHRRSGKARHHRQRELRAGKSSAHGEHARSESGRHCSRYSAARSRRAANGQTAGAELGRHLRRVRHGRSCVPKSRAIRGPRSPAPFESVPGEPGRCDQAITRKC